MQSRTNTPSFLGCGALFLFSVSGASVAGAAPAPRFPTPSGRVVYAMSTTGAPRMSGTIDMRWVQGGQKFRQDMNMNLSMQGRSMAIKSWTIFDSKSMYISSPNIPGAPASARSTVFRMKLPPDYLARMSTGGGMIPGSNGQVSQGKVVGRGTVLGKPCVVRLAPINTPQAKGSLKLWMWNNLPLRTEMNMRMAAAGSRGAKVPPMRMTMNATKLEASTPATPALFRVPTGAKIQDIKAPAR